jgi:hypothetical protein
MKRFFYASFLLAVLFLVGCGFLVYAIKPQTDPSNPLAPPQTPIVQVVKETAQGGMTGFESLGLYGAIAGAVFTFFKSGARVYSNWTALGAAEKVAAAENVVAKAKSSTGG